MKSENIKVGEYIANKQTGRLLEVIEEASPLNMPWDNVIARWVAVNNAEQYRRPRIKDLKDGYVYKALGEDASEITFRQSEIFGPWAETKIRIVSICTEDREANSKSEEEIVWVKNYSGEIQFEVPEMVDSSERCISGLKPGDVFEWCAEKYVISLSEPNNHLAYAVFGDDNLIQFGGNTKVRVISLGDEKPEPKQHKREVWVNCFRTGAVDIYPSREFADIMSKKGYRQACKKITVTWFEGEGLNNE